MSANDSSEAFSRVNRLASTASLALVIIAALLAASSCSIGTSSSPAVIVRKAVEAQGRLKSVLMQMDGSVKVRGSAEPGRSMSSLYRVEGSYEQPDRSSVIVSSSTGETEVVTIGGTAYMRTSPGNFAWQIKDVSSAPAAGTSPEDIKSYLKYTSDLELVEKSEGTYRLKFKLDMGRYAKVSEVPGADPSVFRGMDADMEVWVLQDSFYVKRATMDFEGDLSGIGIGTFEMKVDIEFSDFNKPVGIEAPV